MDSTVLSGVLRDGTASPEAGHGLGLILETRDDFEQVQHAEYLAHAATRTEESQAATLACERDISRSNDAKAGTIDLAQVCEIQEQLAHAAVEQALETAAQQLAFTVADGRPSAKVQYGDIAILPDCDLKAHNSPLPG